MPKSYSYDGESENYLVNITDERMAKYNVNKIAISEFGHALARSDFITIKTLFGKLSTLQKKGLLSFVYDCNTLYREESGLRPPGVALEIATENNQKEIVEFFQAEIKSFQGSSYDSPPIYSRAAISTALSSLALNSSDDKTPVTELKFSIKKTSAHSLVEKVIILDIDETIKSKNRFLDLVNLVKLIELSIRLNYPIHIVTARTYTAYTLEFTYEEMKCDLGFNEIGLGGLKRENIHFSLNGKFEVIEKLHQDYYPHLMNSDFIFCDDLIQNIIPVKNAGYLTIHVQPGVAHFGEIIRIFSMAERASVKKVEVTKDHNIALGIFPPLAPPPLAVPESIKMKTPSPLPEAKRGCCVVM